VAKRPKRQSGSVQGRIDEARRSGAQSLTLQGMELTALPESIGQLTKLQSLDLGNNQLTTLPKSIGQLTQLKELVTLNLGGNGLTALSKSIGQLTQLSVLNLWSNSLVALPDSIAQLVNLESLYLYNNQLTYLPESIAQLCRLRELSAGKNHLLKLPESIGQLTQLRVLDFDDNQLTTLPKSIGNLADLTTLSLAGNRLTTLPDGLRNLNNLQLLILADNLGLGLPPELLGKTRRELEKGEKAVPAEKILEYYSRIRGNKRSLNEAKSILVGRGEVGKTSIVNRLIYNRFDANEKTTEGIKIDTWERVLAGEQIRLNVWDFGGQEIMHATHQFFLTQRSLYLLVLSGRGDAAEDDADYWLKLIASFGGLSPVIVVLNKIEAHRFDVNRRALQAKYPSIKAVVETDCASGIGLGELKMTIERETDRLDGLRDAFPAAWFRIKDELAGMNQNYLTYDEYRAICAQYGETDPAAQESLTLYLHRLGIALNYRDDPRLRDTHVLNPHWVTNGIYTILNSEFVRQRG
jgi:internalin A